MSLRRLRNLSKARQAQLGDQIPGLVSLTQEGPERSKMLWVCVFDHWLSREEANALLENIPADEVLRRDSLLEGFCREMIANTEVLSFAMRGHGRKRPVFRAFKSKDVLSEYCKPGGSDSFGARLGYAYRYRHFQVALPQFGCTFHEYWDYTYYFHLTSPQLENAAREWAARSGVYILTAPVA